MTPPGSCKPVGYELIRHFSPRQQLCKVPRTVAGPPTRIAALTLAKERRRRLDKYKDACAVALASPILVAIAIPHVPVMHGAGPSD
jgi:hypothetical protein